MTDKKLNTAPLTKLIKSGSLIMALAVTTPAMMHDVFAAKAMPFNTQDSITKRFGYRQPGYVNQDSYISDNIYGVENLAYYGDWDSNRIYIIDVDNMTLLTTVENTGDGPYGIDQQSPDKAYALTRKTESLTIVNNHTIENMGLIPLQHKPRSTNFNANTLL